MTEIAELERDLVRAIAAAADERALEEVRVAALGKKGSIAELLKTLGSMSPVSTCPVVVALSPVTVPICPSDWRIHRPA